MGGAGMNPYENALMVLRAIIYVYGAILAVKFAGMVCLYYLTEIR